MIGIIKAVFRNSIVTRFVTMALFTSSALALATEAAKNTDAQLAADDPLAAMSFKHMDKDGTLHIPAFELPVSSTLSEESRAAFMRARQAFPEFQAILNKECPVPLNKAPLEDLPDIRRCRAEAFKKTHWYQDSKARYPANYETQTIDGVFTEIYTPVDGVSKENRHRVLIHLHGGGMQYGAYWQGQISAAPLAAEGGYKVISVDYRQWPEATHPAAVEDILVVYKALLKDYRPENIGVYGCSAGGHLAGQTAAWVADQGLPQMGGVGIFGAGIILGSDSLFLGAAAEGSPIPTIEQMRKGRANPQQYFEGASADDPLVMPGISQDLLSQFPPSLLMSATLDGGLSAVVGSHSRLIKAGVEADLHVWEGLGHCFMTKAEIPEARDATAIKIQFFDKHLGRRKK
jgi:acetyl esterase/lipase